MAVVVVKCSCGQKYRLFTSRKGAAVFHAHFGRTVECDGTCRKTSVERPIDPECARLQESNGAGSELAAAFA